MIFVVPITVEPAFEGHPWNKEKCPLERVLPLMEVINTKIDLRGQQFVSTVEVPLYFLIIQYFSFVTVVRCY